MSSHRLNIISTENKDRKEMRAFSPATNREETQALFERLWHRNPEKFDPLRNCMGKERITRTLQLMDQYFSIPSKTIVDLGCGKGILSLELKSRGAVVTAVDIANNALNKLRQLSEPSMILKNDYIPHTKLEDESFDCVLCTDLIGFLNPREHRLLFSELARLVKKDGHVICSTAIDINSEDSLERFTNLVETELCIEKWKTSHHRYYIRFLDFLKAPKRFARARKDKDYRKEALTKRFYLGKWWFKLNSSPILGEFWNIIQGISNPIFKLVNQSRSFMIILEKLCRFACSENGISHVILIAKRRSLLEAPPVPPIERKQKKTVWE
jgi:2-polyprenyl-3-methyl-5-hydroxy-6-metoxy-1,4-benzoquinol methylase